MTDSEHMALLVGSLRGGGTERICVTLANELADLGYRVDLVVLNLRNAKYEQDVSTRVRLVNLQVKAVRAGFLALRRYLWEARPRLVMTFAPQLAVAIVLLRLTGLPRFGLIARTGTILTNKREHAQDFWNRYVTPTMTRWLYSKADLVVAQSHGMARDLAANHSVPVEKIATIPNPVAPHVLSRSYTRSIDKSLRGSVLFVGRLDPPKDPLFLLRAFRVCTAIRPHLHLDIVGAGSMQTEVEAAISTLGLVDNVTLHGFRSDVDDFYVRASVTVLCSRYEGLPNCLIESIAVGTPVVALDCDHGPRDIVVDGVNGILVSARDEQLFAEAIVRATDREWDASQVLTTASRFHTAAIVSRYQKAITTVLIRSSATARDVA